MIQVLDHVIIGQSTYYSFADEGHIARFIQEYQHTFRSP
jgi:hypothetical protein